MNQSLPPVKVNTPVYWLHNSYSAWLILCCGLILTASVWYVADKYVVQASEQRFELRLKEITSAIQERMSVYEQVLWGGVGFFNAVDSVSRQQWKTYVDAINLGLFSGFVR